MPGFAAAAVLSRSASEYTEAPRSFEHRRTFVAAAAEDSRGPLLGSPNPIEALRRREVRFGPLADGVGGCDGGAQLEDVGEVGLAEDVVAAAGRGGPGELRG